MLEAFSLTRLAENLQRDGHFLKLSGLIRRYVETESAKRDLMISAESMRQLAVRDGAPKIDRDEAHGIVSRAIFSQAIMLYARSTHTSSKIRRTLQVLNYYSEDQRVIHKRIVDLRDHAIAHYGPGGGDLPRLWANDLAVFVRREPYGRVMTILTATNYQKEVGNDLITLLRVAGPIAMQLSARSKMDLEEEIVRNFNEPGFAELLTSSPFDPNGEILTVGTHRNRCWPRDRAGCSGLKRPVLSTNQELDTAERVEAFWSIAAGATSSEVRI